MELGRLEASLNAADILLERLEESQKNFLSEQYSEIDDEKVYEAVEEAVIETKIYGIMNPGTYKSQKYEKWCETVLEKAEDILSPEDLKGGLLHNQLTYEPYRESEEFKGEINI